MRQIQVVVVHCSASPWGNVAEIRKWHTDPVEKGGRGWKDIGYHYVVGNGFPTNASRKAGVRDPASDGAVWTGRDLDRDGDVEEETGAHCPEVNRTSLGVCLVGPDFTDRQVAAAVDFVSALCRKHGLSANAVKGHNEYPSGKHKQCPVIDMDDFRRRVSVRLHASP